MRKNFLLILVFLISASFLKVSALEDYKTSITCAKAYYKVNEEISCDVSINTSKNIYGFSADISSEGATIKLNECASIWQGGLTGSKIGVYNSSPLTGNLGVCNLTILKNSDDNEDIKISLKNVKYTDNNFQTVNDTEEPSISISKIQDDTKKEEDTKKPIKNPETGKFVPIILLIVFFLRHLYILPFYLLFGSVYFPLQLHLCIHPYTAFFS